MPDLKVDVVGFYDGAQYKWAIARFPHGPYRVGNVIHGGISFWDRDFSSRENAEAWLVFHLDPSAKL